MVLEPICQRKEADKKKQLVKTWVSLLFIRQISLRVRVFVCKCLCMQIQCGQLKMLKTHENWFWKVRSFVMENVMEKSWNFVLEKLYEP